MSKKDNSILVGKYIQSILESNEEVMEALGATQGTTRIFPIQQPANINFPFIVYQRNSIIPLYTKDYMGWSNTVQFEIACVSNDYVQSLEIANKVRKAIEWYHWKDENINIIRINIDSINEYAIDSDNATVFVQSISISTSVNPV